MKSKKLFVTVIVCTYNGVNRIEDCLKSLINQTYSKDKYEIIVVDDGSEDKTSEIVSKYNVRLIKHKNNLGIPCARNTGIANAKGNIIAYIDDDCIADKNWLRNLLNPFKNINIMGVGGLTKPVSFETLTEKYMAEVGYGNPIPIEFGKSKNPFYRFLIYLKNMFNPVSKKKGKIIQVQDICTLNACFNKRDIEGIGGFDEELKTSEDTDLCTRLNNRFKNKKIVFTNKAIILHKHRSSLTNLLKQTYFRSENTLKLYFKHKKFPPLFPFPILIVLGFLVNSYFNIFWSLAFLFLFPQIFYFWHFIKFIKKKDLDYILFPYIQFLVELTAILGMLRGYIILKKQYAKK